MRKPRLLIVDDEEKLLELLRRFLERRGFQVVACTSAAAAWESFTKDPHGFAMVIADLTLEDMNGAELIERVRAQNAELPALITSGYPYEPALAGVGFLQKPFLPQTLVDTVEKAVRR